MLRERKLVTLLFVDLTGYTRLASSLDPEDVYAFIRPVMEELVRLAESFGATVPHVMGDGYMAVFGVPAVHEDDPERAVRAALAVVERVRELNAGRDRLRLPEVHAGVNTGEAMVAPAPEASGFAVVGDTVNTASRLAGLAAGGEVMVGERTRQLTGHAIRYGPRLLRRVRGKERALPVYRALGPATEVPGVRPARPAVPFVGRRDALARLEAAFGRVRRRGRSGVLVLAGDAGIGKSRLAREFGARLADAAVLAGRCAPYAQATAFAPLGEALRELAGGPPLQGPLARHLALMLGGRDAAPASPGIAPVSDSEQVVRRVLQAVGRERPTLLMLDDAQWADPELVRCVEGLRSRPLSVPLLILVVGRPDVMALLPRCAGWTLDAMDGTDVRTLVEHLLGPDFPAALARRLVIRAGGNPLFLEESATLLLESGAVVRAADGWRVKDEEALNRVPAGLRSLIAARIDALDAADKRALQDSAVCGDSTWSDLVDMWTEGTGLRTLERLEARGLLRRVAPSMVSGSPEFAFKHTLIRDVAYQSLPRADRAARHVDVAGWLLSRGRRMEREPLALLAYHYEEAWRLEHSHAGPGPSSDTARLAVEYLRRWGDQVFAYQARLADSIYERALVIARLDAGAVGPAAIAETLVAKAESLIELGRHAEAAREGADARALAQEAGRPDVLARALMALGRVESDVGDVLVARRLLEEALRLLGSRGRIGVRALALQRLSETWRRSDFRTELRLLRRSHGLFVRVGDRAGRALLAEDMAYLLTIVGDDEFRERFEECRALAEQDDDLRSRASMLRTSAYAASYRGEWEEALRAAREAAPVAAEAGDRWTEVDAKLVEAQVAAHVRPPEESERLVHELVAVASRAGTHRLKALALMAGAMPAARSGRPALAATRIRTARRTLASMSPLYDLVECDLTEEAVWLDRGATERVGPASDRAVAEAERNGWCLYEPQGPLLRGRALLLAGRAADAAPELSRAAKRAREVGAGGTGALAREALAQARILRGGSARPGRTVTGEIEVRALRLESMGLAALRREEGDAAATAFSRAVAVREPLGLTAWLARALAWRAAALRAAGRSRSAAASRARARHVLTVLRTPVGSARAILEPPLPAG